MAAPYRKNSMMAMLDAKPEVKGIGNTQDPHSTGQQPQFWNDGSDNQSPLRKHLISTYLQVPGEEAMPLLGEYFGVALSFVALGALVRASNSSKRKHKKSNPTTEEERLDLRACSKFERMALESMLKESMDRLGNLSLNAYQLEERVRDLVDENVTRDKEKVLLLKGVADAEKLVVELRALRKAEGRANERVMCIVAAKEQDWLKEKRNLQKEIEKLKETVNGMTREAKLQARRCRNPTCDHCKGIDRAVRNVKGRISLRELHSLREASQRPSLSLPSRPDEAPKVVERQEIEEDRVLMKAIELKKKQRELSTAEKLQQASGSGVDASQSAAKELLVKQQQDMESELANILKRVGMLKQKSYLGVGPSSSMEVTEEMQLPIDSNENPVEQPEDEIAPHLGAGPSRSKEEVQLSIDSNEDLVEQPEYRIASHRNAGEELEKTPANMQDPILEVADFSSQEESDLMELEKAFELGEDEELSAPGEGDHLVSNIAGEDVKAQPEIEELVEKTTSKDGRIPSITIGEEQEVSTVDEELVALEETLSLGDDPAPVPELQTQPDECLEESSRESAGAVSGTLDHPDLVGDGETAGLTQIIEEEHRPEATAHVMCADKDTDEEDLQGDTALDGNCPDTAERPNSSPEFANEDEQVLGVVEDEEDAAEFADALSSPLDPVTCALTDELDPCVGFVAAQPEHDHTDYDNRMDVKENWGFKNSVSSLEGELLENQDIPVFERNNIDDDFSGELPEPEEKRVCGPPETLDSTEALSTDEFSSSMKETSQQEGELLKEKDSTIIEEVGSQQEEATLVEKMGSAAADAKPKSDEVTAHNEDLERADFIS